MIAPLPAQVIRTFGVKAAYTSAYQDFKYKYGDAIEGCDRRKGVDAAIFIEWFDVPFVSALTQLEYAQRGHVYRDTWITGERRWGNQLTPKQDRFDYLSVVPVMGKLRLPIGICSPYVAAGPRFDFLMGYKSGRGIVDPLYEKFNKANIGASVGLGSELHAPLWPVTLSIEARYNPDFTDAYSSAYLKVRNDSFDVWLGVGF